MVEILQCSVVTQTALDGFSSSSRKFEVVYVCQKYESWLAV